MQPALQDTDLQKLIWMTHMKICTSWLPPLQLKIEECVDPRLALLPLTVSTIDFEPSYLVTVKSLSLLQIKERIVLMKETTRWLHGIIGQEKIGNKIGQRCKHLRHLGIL